MNTYFVFDIDIPNDNPALAEIAIEDESDMAYIVLVKFHVEFQKVLPDRNAIYSDIDYLGYTDSDIEPYEIQTYEMDEGSVPVIKNRMPRGEKVDLGITIANFESVVNDSKIIKNIKQQILEELEKEFQHCGGRVEMDADEYRI